MKELKGVRGDKSQQLNMEKLTVEWYSVDVINSVKFFMFLSGRNEYRLGAQKMSYCTTFQVAKMKKNSPLDQASIRTKSE